MDNQTRYIFDPSTLIHEIDSNNVLLKTLSGKFKLSGGGIVFAIRKIMDCFRETALKEDVVEKLNSVYTKTSITKLIELLISKSVLITENTFGDIYSFDSDFLNKYRRLSIGEKGLKEIVSELKAMTIGLICTKQFADCFLLNTRNDQLVGKIRCIITDKTDTNLVFEANRIEVSCLGNNAELQIKKLIEACDFIIVNANYESFSMFSYVNRTCLDNNKKWLRVVIQDEYAEIGPLFIPGETCCYSCMDKRVMDNLREAINIEYLEIQKSNKAFYVEEISTYSSYHFTLVVEAISFYEIMRFFSGLSCPLEGSVLTFFSEDYKMKLRKVFRVSHCECCREQG